jgi:hypothetical protein
MHSHRSFLVLGGDASDIVSLIKGGLEISEFNFSFQQGSDNRGKATTRVHGGVISLNLSQLPPDNIIEWALSSRKYLDGVIVMLDSENMPVGKILFENTACVAMELNHTQSDDSYINTRLLIHAEVITVGNGIDFLNEWTIY